MLPFSTDCLATTIGSVPLNDAREATELILTYTPEIPAWPQLARRPQESMIIQFTEGLPGLKKSSQKLYFDTEDTAFQDEVVHFYEDYLAITEAHSLTHLEKFALTPGYAAGFHALADALTRSPLKPIALKGQVTGPFTLATSLTDQEGKSAFYNPELRDIIVKLLCLKTKWQIHTLRSFGVPVIISVDEPSLVGFGSSAYLGVSAGDIQKDFNEIITVIHGENAYAGIHCCENTDWAMLLSTSLDILSFDAYSFFDKVILYADALSHFIARGGILAWGLIPTSHPKKLSEETVSSLTKRWRSSAAQVVHKNEDMRTLAARSLITPSCGMGSLSPEDTLRVLHLLKGVSEELRKHYCS